MFIYLMVCVYACICCGARVETEDDLHGSVLSFLYVVIELRSSGCLGGSCLARPEQQFLGTCTPVASGH